MSWVLTFVVTLFVPRYLGADMFGRLTTAGAFVTVGLVLAPLGIPQVLTKEIARAPQSMGALMVGALYLRVIATIVLATMTLLAAYLLGYRGEMIVLLTITSIGMVVAGANEVFGAALAGQERFRRQGLLALIDKAIGSGASLALVALRAPVALFAVPGIAAALVQSVMHLRTLRDARRKVATSLSLSRDTVRFLVVAGLPFLGQSAFLTLYGQTDVLVLTTLSDFRTVGWYNVASKLVGTTMFFPVAVSAALLPTLTRLYHGGDEEGFRQIGRRAVEIVLLVGVPIAVIMLMIPDLIIESLYTKEFAGSILVLRIGGLCSLLNYATILLCTMVNSRDQQKQLAARFSIACIAGVPFCTALAWLGERYFGNAAAGAMLSDAIIELILLASLPRILPRGLLGRETLTQCGRFLLASAMMATVLRGSVVAFGSKVWIIVPAGLTYVVMLWALGAITRSYVQLLRQSLALK